MALVLNDRVRETTTIVGTGNATLLGAPAGYQSFSTIGNANTTYYCISDQAGANWEVGIGTYVSATPALARTTVLASSNAGALVSFTAGTKDVFVTYPSEKGVWYDASGNVGIGTSSPTSKLTVGTYLNSSASPSIVSISGANIVASNQGGMLTVSANDAMAADIGGSIGFTANGTISGYPTGSIAGRRENATASNYASYMQFTTSAANGSIQEKMRIDSSGNVGIGTSSPAQKLDILSTTSTVAKLTGGTGLNQGSYLNVQGNYVGNYSVIIGGAYNADLMIYGGGSNIWYQSAGAHIWNAGGASEKMRIDASGNVGIGTSSPSSYGKLVSYQTIDATAAYIYSQYNAGGTSNCLAIRDDRGYGGINSGNTIYALAWSTGDDIGNLLSLNTTNGGAAVPVLVATLNGNVGIGTSSPNVKLDVSSSNIGSTIRVGDYTANAVAAWPLIESFGSRQDSNATFFGRFGASKRRSDGTAIASGQGIGVYAFGGQWGTDTGYNATNLLYAASIMGVSESSFTSATTMSTAIVFNTGSTGGLLNTYNTVYGTERMRIDSSGKVLIGTTAASGVNLLQVNSDALINGITVGRGANSVSSNTALGVLALASASLSGSSNIAVGYQSQQVATTAGNCVSVGAQTLFSNISGSNNTAFGNAALRQNSTGINNVAVGVNALYVATSSVATLGTISGGTGYTDGTYTAVQLTLSSGSPVSSVVGTYPIATIVVAGGVVTTVTLTSFGTCLQNTTTVLTCPAASIGGTVTTAWSVPVASLSTGQFNTALGTSTLTALTTGSYNIGLGTGAGGGITTGSSNVVIGGYTGSAAPISATGSNYIVLSDGAGNIRTYYDSNGNQVQYGVNATSAAAPTIASATTIAPTKAITFISGVTPVVTITAPSPISLGGGTITLIPTGIFTTTIAGNIALASTAVVGRALTMTYDVTTTKWYPSY